VLHVALRSGMTFFTSIQKFSEPHVLRVANGNVVEAVGKLFSWKLQ